MEKITKNNTQNKAVIYRKELLADLPVRERHLIAGGMDTMYLEGGEGIPMVLLHGPGESALWWMRVIPDLVKNYKIIVPDLPGNGSSGSPAKRFTRENILVWLDELIDKTCNIPPVIIGHVVGGAIAARYAVRNGKKLKQLVLVDSLGLSAFRPAPLFAFELIRFMINPNEKSYSRFLPHCMYDVNELGRAMGRYWQPFLDYNLASAKNPKVKTATKRIMNLMSGRIPGDDLAKINTPVTLIWGRYDKANSIKIALKASKKYGWPLHVIEDTRDDPKLEKPNEFVEAVRSSVAETYAEKLE
jgi:pimeloyl-ACP methyl ester carboxylesterase